MIFKLYNKHIFPHLLNQVMQTPSLMDARRQLLNQVKGNCLEIGFGTGLNLAFYQDIECLYALEPSQELWDLAADRLKQTNFEVKQIVGVAEHIPLADESVDYVISTWTMCSISKLPEALAEIHRVLKPNGTFSFVEHVLADEKKLQTLQNLLTPVQKKLADGCHLNRNIEKIVSEAGFKPIEINYFQAQGIPSIGRRMLLAHVQKS